MLRQIFAVVAYLGTLGIVTYAAVWVNNLGEISPTLAPAFPLGIDGASLVDLKLGDGAAAFFNIALLCLFALQHNVMSRLGIKAKMRKSAIPFSWERSVIIATAGFAFGTALLLWQPLPWRVWQGAFNELLWWNRGARGKTGHDLRHPPPPPGRLWPQVSCPASTATV